MALPNAKNSQFVQNPIFPNGKNIFHNFREILKFEVIEYM